MLTQINVLFRAEIIFTLGRVRTGLKKPRKINVQLSLSTVPKPEILEVRGTRNLEKKLTS